MLGFASSTFPIHKAIQVMLKLDVISPTGKGEGCSLSTMCTQRFNYLPVSKNTYRQTW